MKLFDAPDFLIPPSVANSIRCPICGSSEVEYEFVVERLAYSRCRECSLLFANPGRQALPAAPLGSVADSVFAAAQSAASRCSGRELSKAVIVTEAVGPGAPAEAEALSVAQFAVDDRAWELIVLFASLERSTEPYSLLSAARDKLSEHGRVVIAFPSQTSREALVLRERWSPFVERIPLIFSVDTAQAAATRAGFTEFLTFTDANDVPEGDRAELASWFEGNAMLIAAPAARPPNRMLSVIFPVYNEALTVRESLERVLQKNIAGIAMEVIVVENGSTDGTREIVNEYAGHPKVRIVHEEFARGKGYAVRIGLRHASGEVILFQDADLEYDIDDYDALVAPLFALKRNFVLGSRHNARGTAWKIRRFEEQPVTSAIVNLAHLGLLALFNLRYRQTLQDPFTMYKVFRRDCLYGLTFEDNRFDFDHEINIKLLRKGYRPVELPVNYQSRSFKEGKKIAFFRDPPTWIRAIMRHRTTTLYEFLRDGSSAPFPAVQAAKSL